MTGDRLPHLADETDAILQRFGVARPLYQDGERIVHSPLTGEPIAHVRDATPAEINQAIETTNRAFETWRSVPAPRRGELVRLLGAELRAAKDQLGRLVTIEAGKIATGRPRRSPGND